MKRHIYILFSFVLYLHGLAQNTSNVSGSFDIGPIGNATYNIPIDLPPGTAGLQPNISIVYNSFSGDGIMGKGFSVSALSSITRVSKTIFHDGAINDIEFNSTDKYTLDGNRLMYNSLTGEYRTEINPYSKINIISANTSSAHFEVRTREGLILEYGNTADSRLCAQSPNNNQVSFWMVNKVRDRVGNYYTYDKNESSGEIRLKQIDYTGSASRTPYCSVKFTYTARNYDVNLNYIAGSKFKESKLLSEIGVYYGTSLFRKYNLSYNYDGNDYTYLLSKITVTGTNNETLKPLTFSWYKNTDFKQTQVVYDQSTYAANYVNKSYISLGDFNGDGRTDFIASPTPDATWTGWRLFLADSNGNRFTYSGTGSLPADFKEIIPGDFNGDGITDFIARRETISRSVMSDSISSNENQDGSVLTFENDQSNLNDNSSLSDSLVPSNGDIAVASVTYQNYFVYYGTGNGFIAGPSVTTESRPHGVRVADFNGDGAMDLFVYYTSKSAGLHDFKICMSGFSAGNLIAFNTIKSGIINGKTNWDRVEVWDFNGDGLAEVMNLKENGYEHYYNNGFGSVVQDRTGTLPNKNHIISFGDFNGDRKIDMLLTGWNNTEWSNWQTLLSTGAGFESYSFPKKFTTYSKDIFVCDLNGDGCDDFFAVDKVSGSSTTPLKCYLGYDSGRNFKEYSSVNTYGSDKWNFYPLDTRADGKLGFLVVSAPFSWNGYQLYMPNADFSNLLKSTTDSHGNITTVTYKKMADTSIYTKTVSSGGSSTVAGYDCLSFTAPFKLVSNVSTSNGIGGTNSISYNYENAKVCKRGRGFLGFAKTIMNDLGTSIKTTVTQEFSGDYYQAATKSVEKVYVPTNRKLTQVDYVNTLVKSTDFSGSFAFHPTSVKEQSYEPAANKLTQSVTTSYSYDAYGNVLTQTATYGNGDIQKVTNTYSNNTANWLLGLLTRSVSVSTVNGSSQTNTVDYAYDANGLLKTQTVEPNQSAYKTVVTFQYDGFGNVTSKTKTVGSISRIESYAYDNGRFLKTYTNVLGQIESSTYDAITGLLVSQTDISGDVYTYTYDGFGKIKTKSQKSATGNTAMINWAWTNNSPNHSVILRTETMGDGQVMKIWYDALGREIQSSYKNFLGKEVYMVTTYDALGRTTQVSEPYYSGASSIQYHASQYDSFGRISKQITPLGTISYSYSGNQTTINDGTKGYTTIRETDLAGKLKRVTDPGGTITYTYGPSGNPTKIVCGSTTSTMEYDLLGRRTKLIDPNAGTILCSYDGWGNLKKQTDARGQAEEYIYENSGRLQTYKRGTESFSYVYDPTYKNQVKSVIYGGVKTEYGYGTYGRLSSKTETVDSKSFKFSYTYNDKGQLETMTYPNSKSIKYEYVNGDLYKMIWLSSNTTVWQKGNENAKGQLLSSTLGNSIQESYVYNAVGMPTSIQAKKGSSTLLNISYPSIDTHQNIRERKDLYKSLSESFTYDDMNRLTTGVTYSANGNITSKVNVGSYQYDSNHPHAVKSVNFNGAAEFNNSDLLVTYNSVRMPIQLTEGNKVYTLTYNGENTRIKSLYKENNSSVFTKYYSGPYEEIQKGSITQKNYYIYAGGQIAAVYTEGSSDAGMYYFHNDHLGSPWLITNTSGNEVQRLNFDAWGRRRDASNWSNYVNLPTFKFDRGFTGHEHLDMFGLINMNARLYDPLLGRFLSPDPIVQAPEFTQSFNGYTYALNNPLAYTDPNGESLILAAAIIGGWIGMGSAMVSSEKSGWGLAGDMFKGLFVGAASGAAGAWAGGAVAGSLTAGGFISGGLTGMASGFSGGFVGCSGNAWLSGAGFGGGLKAGLIGGGLAGAFSGFTGGLIRGFTDMANGYNFWNGSKTSEFVIGVNHAKIAENYNSSLAAEFNDENLNTRILEEFDIQKGDMGIEKITTKTGRKYGMITDETYVNKKTGANVAGYLDRFSGGKSELHISPKFAGGNIVDFRAVVGHELIHAYHHNILMENCLSKFTESVAYRYSAGVYFSAGRIQDAIGQVRTALKLNFWQSYPSSYSLPKMMKFR